MKQSAGIWNGAGGRKAASAVQWLDFFFRPVFASMFR